MTSELEDRYTDLRFSPYGTAFLTDAIIVQRYIEVDSRLRRVMAVVKVRAQRAFGRAAPVQHRRRRHPHRRDAARPGRPAGRAADPPGEDQNKRVMTPSTDERHIAIATRTLALLNQQADSVRAELQVLRNDLSRVQNDMSGIPSARLLEANEKLVMAALRAQGIADTARRRLGEVTRAPRWARPFRFSRHPASGPARTTRLAWPT